MLAQDLVKVCPFWNPKTEKLECNLKMMRDLVLIWQPEIVEKTKGGIILPEEVREDYKPKIGVIVSIGRGYYDNWKFNPTFLKRGMVVVIDIRTPAFHGNKEWRMDATDYTGKVHSLPFMGEKDIRILIDPDQEIDEIGSLIQAGRYNTSTMEIKS